MPVCFKWNFSFSENLAFCVILEYFVWYWDILCDTGIFCANNCVFFTLYIILCFCASCILVPWKQPRTGRNTWPCYVLIERNKCVFRSSLITRRTRFCVNLEHFFSWAHVKLHFMYNLEFLSVFSFIKCAKQCAPGFRPYGMWHKVSAVQALWDVTQGLRSSVMWPVTQRHDIASDITWFF
jgi:hypothetical protein